MALRTEALRVVAGGTLRLVPSRHRPVCREEVSAMHGGRSHAAVVAGDALGLRMARGAEIPVVGRDPPMPHQEVPVVVHPAQPLRRQHASLTELRPHAPIRRLQMTARAFTRGSLHVMPDPVAAMTSKTRLHRRELLHRRDFHPVHRVAARASHALPSMHRVREVEPRCRELRGRSIHMTERAARLGASITALDLRRVTRQARALLRDQEIRCRLALRRALVTALATQTRVLGMAVRHAQRDPLGRVHDGGAQRAWRVGVKKHARSQRAESQGAERDADEPPLHRHARTLSDTKPRTRAPTTRL